MPASHTDRSRCSDRRRRFVIQFTQSTHHLENQPAIHTGANTNTFASTVSLSAREKPQHKQPLPQQTGQPFPQISETILPTANSARVPYTVPGLVRKLKSQKSARWLFTGSCPTSSETPAHHSGCPISAISHQIRHVIGRRQDLFVRSDSTHFNQAKVIRQFDQYIMAGNPDVVFLHYNAHFFLNEDLHPASLEQDHINLIHKTRNSGIVPIVLTPVIPAKTLESLPNSTLHRIETIRASTLESPALMVDLTEFWEENALQDWWDEPRYSPSPIGAHQLALFTCQELKLTELSLHNLPQNKRTETKQNSETPLKQTD